jgi:hypothetical protein
MTSMMKEFAVFLSEDANRATAAGHHSPFRGDSTGFKIVLSCAQYWKDLGD